MKIKSLLLVGLSVGFLGLTQQDTAQASTPWLNITDKSAPRTDFVDISSHNGVPTVAEFKIMKSYGVKGVMVKLTEATSYRNPYAASQIANAKAAGLQIGGYHYSWYSTPEEARVEGRYFAQFAKELGLAKNTPMADDLEEPQMMAVNANGRVNNNIQGFRSGVLEFGYNNNILYTYASYASQTGLNQTAFGKRNIWMASYPFTPSKDSLWHTDVGMWQFNDNMHFPNVRGTFDANIDYAGIMAPAKPKPKKVNPTPVTKYMKFDQKTRNDGLYANAPYGYDGAKLVGRAKHDVSVKVEQQATGSNGVIWYYGKVNNQYVWFDAKAVVPDTSLLNATTVNKNFIADQTLRNDGLYANAPFGYDGGKFVGRMPNNRVVKVQKQLIANDGTIWYYGNVNGQNVWFDSKAVIKVAANATATPVNREFISNQTNRNDGLYGNAPYGYSGTIFAGRMPNNRTIMVEKQMIAPNGTVWYYGKVDGQYVWFDAKAVVKKPVPLKTTPVNAQFVSDQARRNDGLYANAPYSYDDAKFIGRMPNNLTIMVEKQLVAPNGTVWYYGKVSGQYVWFDAKAVVKKPAALNTTPVNKTFVTDQARRNDGLYANAPYNYDNAKLIGRMPNNLTLLVEKQLVAPNGVVWYYAKVNGQYVWFDAKAVKDVAKKATVASIEPKVAEKQVAPQKAIAPNTVEKKASSQKVIEPNAVEKKAESQKTIAPKVAEKQVAPQTTIESRVDNADPKLETR